MAHVRQITLNEYLGIVDESQENGPNARAIVLESQGKWWNIFYKRNENRFFKDRHWTMEEFPELTQTNDDIVVFEAGCGVGNFVIPLMEMNHKLSKLYACDISEHAISILKRTNNFDANRCTAFQCDLSTPPNENLHRYITTGSVDVATLVFVLSAIPPEKDNMATVLRNLKTVLKPGGLVLFRDYAEGDHAQFRFEDAGEAKKPLSSCDKCFLRRDNTLSYFFTVEEANQLFLDQCGFELVESCYVYREVTNRKEGVTFKRKFIQGRYKNKAD